MLRWENPKVQNSQCLSLKLGVLQQFQSSWEAPSCQLVETCFPKPFAIFFSEMKFIFLNLGFLILSSKQMYQQIILPHFDLCFLFLGAVLVHFYFCLASSCVPSAVSSQLNARLSLLVELSYAFPLPSPAGPHLALSQCQGIFVHLSLLQTSVFVAFMQHCF